MTEILTFSTDEVAPDRNSVLENQGIPSGTVLPEQIEVLCVEAFRLLSESAAPVGILSEISKPDFEDVYYGEGRNEPSTPVADILGQADSLALFAITLGGRIGREIDRRFESNDLALASMLDSVASAAADRTAELAERRFLAALLQTGRLTPFSGGLRYSPGYCGWHVSGQRRVFEFLRPGRIGVSLRDSFLMEPLKSVTGVIIVGPKTIHDFQDSYLFCSRCETHGCRERLRALLAE